MEKEGSKKGQISFVELLDTLEVRATPFPYKDYKIVGDIEEIDRIINTCGYINLNVPDIVSVLSKETINYVAVGMAVGNGCVAVALKNAIDKLPIKPDCISKILFNIWFPKEVERPLAEIAGMVDFIKNLSVDFDFFWGCACEEALKVSEVKITLIAASK